jgi:predicted DNA-binding ribbon-helix-helix protein
LENFNIYGLVKSTRYADYKAVSMNGMHTSVQITDQFYSNITDEEIKKRIGSSEKEKPLSSKSS